MNTKTKKLTAAQQRTWNLIANAFQNQVRGSYSSFSQKFVVTEDGELHSVYGSGINGRTLQALAKAGLIVFTDGTRYRHPHFKLTAQGLDALPDIEEDTPETKTDDGIPPALADSYDSAAEFASEVRRLWSLDECCEYPCPVTLTHALELMRGMAKLNGYETLLPAYEKFVAVCKDDALLMDADKLLEDYAPKPERDSRYYGNVRR